MVAILQSFQRCIIPAPKSQSYEWMDSKAYVFFSPIEKDVTNGAGECWLVHKSA